MELQVATLRAEKERMTAELARVKQGSREASMKVGHRAVGVLCVCVCVCVLPHTTLDH